MTTEEITVDANLENFLDERLQTVRRVNVERVEDDDLNLDEEEEDSGNDPQTCTEAQRLQIYSLLAYVGTGIDHAAMLPLIEKVKKLTKEEADTYLECLRSLKHQKLSARLTRLIIEGGARACLPPGDCVTRKEMVADEVLIEESSSLLGNLLARFGKYTAPAVFMAYVLAGWVQFYNASIENKRASEERHNAEAAV
jgi:hypothetical protein